MTTHHQESSGLTPFLHRLMLVLWGAAPIVAAVAAYSLVGHGAWSPRFAAVTTGATLLVAVALILVFTAGPLRLVPRDRGRVPSWWLAVGVVFWLSVGGLGLGELLSLLQTPSPYAGFIVVALVVASALYLDRVWEELRPTRSHHERGDPGSPDSMSTGG